MNRNRGKNLFVVGGALLLLLLLLCFLFWPLGSPAGERLKGLVFGRHLAAALGEGDRSGPKQRTGMPNAGQGGEQRPRPDSRGGIPAIQNDQERAMPSESEQNRENVLGDNPTFRTNTLDQSTDATGPPAESAESPSTPAQGNPGDQTDENRSGLYSIDAAEAAQGFFGSRGAGTRFVYVIDRSGSMTGGRFESARAELIRSLQSLRPPMMFHVIFYDSVYEAMPARRMLPATTANILGTIRWILTQNPGRGTEPGPAMLNALNLKPDTIWLLSDGEFNPAIADDIRDANAGQRVMIHTIAFHDPSGQAVLRRIAQENRGQFRYVVGR